MHTVDKVAIQRLQGESPSSRRWAIQLILNKSKTVLSELFWRSPVSFELSLLNGCFSIYMQSIPYLFGDMRSDLSCLFFFPRDVSWG